MSSITDRHAETLATLRAHGQEHLLAGWERLGPGERASLLDQIDALDLEMLDELIERFVRDHVEPTLPTDLEPAPVYARDGNGFDEAECRARGEALVRAGAVAAFTVAGGQGTRLGWKGPKGTYPATVITGKPLFRVFAEQIIAAQRAYGVTIPWYIMTSPINDAETRAFFEDNNCFGLERTSIFMFPQGMMPSIDAASGRLLLDAPGCLAMNPDGHGGSLRALASSGALEDMRVHGIEHVSYFQVDNPLVKIIDPLFIGLHAGAEDSSGEMSSKMVPKTEPGEKVGVFCRSGGKTVVVEYSDLPTELAEQRDADGRLHFRAGSIAIHLIGVEFIERLTADERRFALPFHRAVKKVPHVDPETGARIEPDEPNAVKLETFVFDALPLARSSIVLETSRVEEFAPIKNASGADSPETSHQLQSDRAGAWLEDAGVTIPRRADGHVDAAIEISPLSALDAPDVTRLELPSHVAPGDEILL